MRPVAGVNCLRVRLAFGNEFFRVVTACCPSMGSVVTEL